MKGAGVDPEAGNFSPKNGEKTVFGLGEICFTVTVTWHRKTEEKSQEERGIK